MRIDPFIDGNNLPLTDNSALRFPLAELSGFDPSELFNNQKYLESDKLILSLSLVYHDLKNALLFSYVIDELRPEMRTSFPPDKHHGQFSGMLGWLNRILISILEELCVLLDKKRDIIQSRPFELVTAVLQKETLQSWNQLLELAGIRKEKDPWVRSLKTLLTQVRATGTYHYYQNELLMRSYKKFYAGEENSFNKFAYLSLGRNVEETRFYFVDASIDQQTKDLVEKTGISVDEFNIKFDEYLQALHFSIRFIIEKYFEHRNIKLSKIEPTNV